MVTSPRKAFAGIESFAARPNKTVAGAKEIVAPEDSMLATWRQILAHKNIQVIGPKKGVAGGKDFPTAPRRGVVQTTSSTHHVGEMGSREMNRGVHEMAAPRQHFIT